MWEQTARGSARKAIFVAHQSQDAGRYIGLSGMASPVLSRGHHSDAGEGLDSSHECIQEGDISIPNGTKIPY